MDVTTTVTVDVLDDAPELTVSSDPNDTLGWEGGASGAYTTEHGSLTLKTGADGLKEGSLKVTDGTGNSATFDAEGTAIIRYEDGSELKARYDASTGKIEYTYTPGVKTETTERSFTFSAQDTDDDPTDATINVKIDLVDSEDVSVTIPPIEVDESGLTNGTTPNEDLITKQITLPEGYTLNTDGWTPGEGGALTLTVNDGKGLLTYKDGQLTYTLQDSYTHGEPYNDNEGLVDGSKPTFDLNLTHKDTGVDVTTTVTVDVLDDGPEFTEESFEYEEDSSSNADKLWQYDKGIRFDTNRDYHDKQEHSYDLETDKLTISVGKVYYDEYNGNITENDIKQVDTDNDLGKLHYDTGYGSTNGLGVTSKIDDNLTGNTNNSRNEEICYTAEENASEAIVFDLNGKLAQNVSIELGNFRIADQSESEEVSVFIFYRDGQIVRVESVKASDLIDNPSGEDLFADIPGGFDKLVIAAGHNGESGGDLDSFEGDDSDFTISSIKFNTLDEEIMRTLTGSIEANSADGIKEYGFADVTYFEQLGLKDDTGKNLEFTIKNDGYTSTLTATDDSGKIIFEVSLDTQAGGWTLRQSGDYSGSLKLGFTATDGDSDTTPCDVEIKEPVQPSTTELTLFEAGMDNGSEASSSTESATGHLTLKEGATPVSITINEQTISLDPVADKPIELKNGDTFTINNIANGKLTYTYTLGKARDHTDDGNQITENLNIAVSYEDAQKSDTNVKLIIEDDNMSVDIDHARRADTGKITGISADGDVTYHFDRNSMPDTVGPWTNRKDVSWTISHNNNGTQTLTGTIREWNWVWKEVEIFTATLDKDGTWKITNNSNDINTICFIVKDGDGDEQQIAVDLNKDYPNGRMTSATGKESSRAISEAAAAAAMVGMVTAVAQHAAAEDHLSSDDSETSVRPEAVVQGVPTTEGAEAYAATDADMLTATDEDPLALLDNLNALAEDGLLFENLRNLDADALEHLADSLENLEATTAEQDGDAVAGSGNGSMSSAEEESGDTLTGTNGDDLLAGDEGNDMLFGNAGNDVLLGMGGDDYLDGGEGEDMLFGGSGDDIIVYDSNDYLVDGGSGIDFMVSQDDTLSLDYLLTQSGRDVNHTGPIVNDVEVLITGENALSLTNIGDLAKYGITLGTNARGDETLSLDMSQWEQSGENGRFTYTGSNDVDLTLETNLPPSDPATPDNSEAQTQVFILENSNG